MPGLLDGIASNPLIGMGMGLLGQSGYSAMPVSMGQALGAGFQGAQRAGLLGQQQALATQAMAMRKAQQEKMRREAEAAERQAEMAARQSSAATNAAALLPPEHQELYRALVESGQVDKATELLAQVAGPQAPPSVPAAIQTFRHVSEMTPEEQAAYYDHAERMKQAGVVINQGGYQPQSPEAKAAADLAHLMAQPPSPARDAAITTIESRLTPGAPSASEFAQIRDRTEALDQAEDALKRYESLLLGKKVGPGGERSGGLGTEFTGSGAAALKSARTNLLLQAKELPKLGALSGPDMELIEGLVGKDPTGLGTNIAGALTFGTNLESYAAGLDEVRQMLNSARSALKGRGGIPLEDPSLVPRKVLPPPPGFTEE